MLSNVEFFIYNSELWYCCDRADMQQLTENNHEMVNELYEYIEQFYPDAFEALNKEYKKCKPNLPFFKFRVVNRFCRCNFGLIDNVADIEHSGKVNFEHVPCPLRGECKVEHIVCSPKFNHQISTAEYRVLSLLYRGMAREQIADRLYLSIFTVNNHIRRAYTRLGLHSNAEFTKWATENNIFSNEL